MAHLQDQFQSTKKHPEVPSIEDVISFRLLLLVSIGERAGHDWSQRLFGLSLLEWRLLALVQSRAPCRIGALSDLLHIDKSQASRVMKSLLSKALIEKGTDSEDGRASALSMTVCGAQLYEEMMLEVMCANERILFPLTREEIAVFSKTLSKLIAHSQDLLEARLGREITR